MNPSPSSIPPSITQAILYNHATMGKIQTFIYSFSHSLSDTHYYNDILRAKLSFSLKYFAFFFLLISVCQSLLFYIQDLPELKQETSQALDELATNYPDDLVIIIDQNQLFVSGVVEPFHVSFPTNLADSELTAGYDHFMTIDSTRTSITDKSLLALTQDKLVFRSPDNTKQHFPYEEIVENAEVTNDRIQEWVEVGKQAIVDVSPYVPVGLFAINFFFGLPFSLITLPLYTLMLYAVLSILGKRYTFKKAYQLSLHISSFAMTLNLIRMSIYPDFGMPNFYLMAFIGASILIAFSLKKPKIYRIISVSKQNPSEENQD